MRRLPGSPLVLSHSIVPYPCIKSSPTSKIHLPTVFGCDPHRTRLQVCRHTSFLGLSVQKNYLDGQAVQAHWCTSGANPVGHAIRSHWWRYVHFFRVRCPAEVVELLLFRPGCTSFALGHYKLWTGIDAVLAQICCMFLGYFIFEYP